MGSAAASSSGVNRVPEELLGILYTLHLPFPSDQRVEVFFRFGLAFFSSLGVLKATFWFTFGVAI